MGANTHASAPLVVRMRARTIDEPYGIAEQQYAHDALVDAACHSPTSLGAEAAVKERWERVRRIVRRGREAA